jgi:hypothetical protein
VRYDLAGTSRNRSIYRNPFFEDLAALDKGGWPGDRASVGIVLPLRAECSRRSPA